MAGSLPINKPQALAALAGGFQQETGGNNIYTGGGSTRPSAGAGFIQQPGGNNIFVGEDKPSGGTNGYVTTSITDLQQRVARLEELVARLIGAHE